MNVTEASFPGQRRDRQRDDHAREPLQGHQHREHAVGSARDDAMMLVEQRFAALGDPCDDSCRKSLGKIETAHIRSCYCLCSSAQPKTLDSFRSLFLPLRIWTSASPPALSPMCPRDGVMPPLKSNCRSAS